MKRVLEPFRVIVAVLFCVAGTCSTSTQPRAPAVNHRQFLCDLVAAAIERTRHEVTYDPG